MNSLGTGSFSHVQNFVDDQITVAGWRGANVVRLVGIAHMGCVAVGIGINSHCLNPQLVGRPQNAHRNFTPVGDEQLVKFFG